LKRLDTKTHISIGLVGITMTILFTAIGLGLIRSSYSTHLEARAKLCESLAIQFCMDSQKKQIRMFKALAPIIVRRNQDILSMGIRRTDGRLLAATDNHGSFWKDIPANRSTETHVKVPLFQGNKQFGIIEICLTPLNSDGILGLLRRFHLPLVLFMAVSGFVAYWLYLKKVLRHLDPSSVVPDRVRAALDTLSESVVITDSKEQIVLANEAFTEITGQPISSLLGCRLSLLPCIKKSLEQRPRDFPWGKALHQGIAEKGIPLVLESQSGEVCSSIVNTTPIPGSDGKQKGIMASFTDVTELEQKNKALVETSRLAGMAEVATDVLHNVGNVLNSVNVSTTSINENLSGSQLPNVKKVAEMLSEHIDDIGTFLTKDSRGRHIPNYLIRMTETLLNEQANLREKVQSIKANIDHIKEIISMQQSHARIAGFQMESSLVEVVEDAIQINQAALERCEISVVKEFGEVGIVTIDKPRVLQIVINLIRNASEALAASSQKDKLLTVRCYKHEEKSLRIEVLDNGIGIPSECLTKIFQHGFTTKDKGHGFGLHSSALAAHEMGGSLSAHSKGLGHGAKFILEFPLKLERTKHEAGKTTQSTNINY